MADAASIGKKYGQSITDFAKASKNTIEEVVLNHSNESIKIMRNQIRYKSKRDSTVLAQTMHAVPVNISDGIRVVVMTEADYWKFVNFGVRGVRKNNGAKKSKEGIIYKFKNLYTSKNMVDSFKGWAAAKGIKSVGGKTLSYKGKSRKQAISDQEQVAKTLATYTKIGGIAPMGFLEKATTKERNKELANKLKVSIGQVLRLNIKKF